MDSKDFLFVFLLLIGYALAFVAYVAVGNKITGQKVTKVGDFLSPPKGRKNKPDFLFIVYYLGFLVFVVASSFKVMSLRSTFRAWIDRLLGSSHEEDMMTNIDPSVSALSMMTQASTSQGIPSQTSLNKKQSKNKMKESSSQSKMTPPSKKKVVEKKMKIPNVMRSSVVDPENQIIPPLPRLSIREDTAQKLSRVLLKFDSMDFGKDEDLTPPSKRKEVTPTGKSKKE